MDLIKLKPAGLACWIGRVFVEGVEPAVDVQTSAITHHAVTLNRHQLFYTLH